MKRYRHPSLFIRLLLVLLILVSQVWLVSAAAPPDARPSAESVHAAFLRPAAATDVQIGYRVTLDAKAVVSRGKPAKPPAATATGILGTPCTGQRYALVMGINDYPGSASDLSYCVADAWAVRDVLVAYGFPSANITFLQDRQVTREAIDAFTQSRTFAAEDEIFVFYSGHGSKGRADDYDTLKTDQAIVVCNATYTGFDSIWDGELKRLFSAVPTNRIVFAFDSCYAGGMTVLGRTGGEVVMACTANALSYESSAYGGGHGAFTWFFFCEGIAARKAELSTDDNDIVTIEEAFDYAKPLLGSQTPVLNDGLENDFAP